MGARFQELFHSPPGVLFTFPSRYWYAIGQTGMLRVTPRSGRIHTGFHESRATWETRSGDDARSATGPSPSAARHSIRFASHAVLSLGPAPSETGHTGPQHPTRNPRRVSHAQGLAWSAFARHRNSPVHSSIGTPSHLHVLRLLVDIRFQVLFHSPPGVLFTFPSRYYTLSVAKKYFALEGGPPCFPRGFTCPAVLWITASSLCLSSTGLLPPMADLSRSFD